MKQHLGIVATWLIGWQLTVGPAPARSEIIMYEGFDYGEADGSIDGKSGGFGFGGAWTVVQSGFATGGSYQQAGLSFGSNFAVTGGNAVVYGGGPTIPSQRTTDYRPIGVNQTGTIYGSFLFNTQNDTTYGSIKYGINSLLIGPATTEDTSVYELASNEFNSNNGAVRGPASPGYPSYLIGAEPELQTTYLYLYKITGVGGAGGTTDAWVLTQDQYDHFKTAGSTPGVLLESDLNAALIGSGSDGVWERGSFSGSGTGTFSTLDYLTMFGFSTQGDTLSTLMDEIRVGNASLDEVAPLSVTAVPEPSSLALAAAVGGITLWRRRRRDETRNTDAGLDPASRTESSETTTPGAL